MGRGDVVDLAVSSAHLDGAISRNCQETKAVADVASSCRDGMLGQSAFIPDDQTRKRIIKEVYTGKYEKWYTNGDPARVMDVPENIQIEVIAFAHCMAPYQRKMMEEGKAQANKEGGGTIP